MRSLMEAVPESVIQISLVSILVPHSLTFSTHSWRSSLISTRTIIRKNMRNQCSSNLILCCAASSSAADVIIPAPPLVRKRRRYIKLYPSESKGITEEMRFVAMRLRNVKGEKCRHSSPVFSTEGEEEEAEKGDEISASDVESNDGGGGESWKPSLEGFLKYLVDSKLVFNTVERIVDESSDVSYAYFRKTGLESLEWFREQGIVIPEPSTPGITYSKYLQGLTEKSAPLFLCHFYNIYFSHIAGGQVIARQVSENLLEGKEMDFTHGREMYRTC